MVVSRACSKAATIAWRAAARGLAALLLALGIPAGALAATTSVSIDLSTTVSASPIIISGKPGCALPPIVTDYSYGQTTFTTGATAGNHVFEVTALSAADDPAILLYLGSGAFDPASPATPTLVACADASGFVNPVLFPRLVASLSATTTYTVVAVVPKVAASGTNTATLGLGLEPTITYADKSVAVGATGQFMTATRSGAGAIAYTSQFPFTVADIHPSTGALTIIGAGTTQVAAIVAEESGSGTYGSGVKEATLTVTGSSTYTVTYNGNTNTGGTAPTDGSSPYASGNTVTVLGNTGSLTKTGYTFSNWNTAANGGGTDRLVGGTFVINANTTLYAQWAATYAITAVASPVAGGSVSCTPNPVIQGTNSTCTATTNTGYTFSAFSGDCTGATCTLTNVTSARSVTATFALQNFCAASPCLNGGTCSNGPTTFICSCATGYTGTTCGSVTTYSITTSVVPVSSGTVTCSPNPVNHGSNSTCTATPASNYVFSAFSGDCTGASCTLDSVTTSKSVTATFTLNCPVGTAPSGNSCVACPAGRFSPTGASCNVCVAGSFSAAGASVCTSCPVDTYSATPGSASCTLCAVGFTAQFPGSTSCTLKTYSITAVASPVAGGGVSCTPNPVSHGSNSTCTATTNTGYTFSAFSGDCTGATCTLTNVTAARSVTATFTQNFCSANPCLNGGTCVNGVAGFTCSCASGFSGSTCALQAPTVIAVAPQFGVPFTATLLTITGTNFGSSTAGIVSVTYRRSDGSGTPGILTSVALLSSTRLTATTGVDMAPGAYDISVTTQAGTGSGIGLYTIVAAAAPTVTTPTSASITATSATLGGNVTSDGGAAITERGVVYSLTGTNADPLIGGAGVARVTGSAGIGVFSVVASVLTASSGYSYKAYAANNAGTSYSTVATFTTPALNFCAASPCLNGGTCVNGAAGFTCSCASGFSGSTCALQAPTVIAVAPQFGVPFTATLLTITGTNFGSSTAGIVSVTYRRSDGSGTPGILTSVALLSSTRLTATTGVDLAPGAYDISVTTPAGTGIGIGLYNVAAPPVKLAFTTQPAGAAPATAFTTQPVVTIQRADGTTDTSATSTVTLAIKVRTGTPTAVLTSTATAAVAGVATFAGARIDLAGTGYVLTASATDLTASDSTAFNVATPPASLTDVNFSVSPATALSPATMTVQFRSTAALVAGDTITATLTGYTLTGGAVTITSGTGFDATATLTGVSTGSVVTVTLGGRGGAPAGTLLRFSFPVTNPLAGTISKAGLTVATTQVTTAVASASDIIIAPPAPSVTNVNISVSPAIANATGTTVTVQFTAQTALPPDGKIIVTLPGFSSPATPTVTFSAPSALANTAAFASDTLTVTIVAGAAAGFYQFSVRGLSNPAAGTISRAVLTVRTATASGAPIDNPGASASDIVITSGVGTKKLAFNTQPAGAVAGTIFTTQPKVAIQDANGNQTADTDTVSLAIKTGTGTTGATLTCTSQAAVAGLATFTDCKIDLAGTGYVLTATSGRLSSVDSTAFVVSPAASSASKLVFMTQPAALATVGRAFARQPVVTIQKADGTTDTSATGTVTLAIRAGTGATGAILSGTLSLVAMAGVATFTGIAIDRAGTGYVLTASATGLTSADSSAVTVQSPVTATKLVFTSQLPTSLAVGERFSLSVAAQDASGNNNPDQAGVVSLTSTASAGVLNGVLTANFVAGVASFSGLYFATASATGYTLTVFSGTLTSATSTSIVVTASRPATKLVFRTSPGDALAGATFARQPVVEIQDATGQTITTSTATVSLSIKSGTGTAGAFLTCPPVAAVAGVATFSGCRIDPIGKYTLTATSTGLTSADSTSFTVVGTTAEVLTSQVKMTLRLVSDDWYVSGDPKPSEFQTSSVAALSISLRRINLISVTPGSSAKALGERVVLEITYDKAFPAGTKYLKLVNGAWVDWTDKVQIRFLPASTVVTLTLTDNGEGDDDPGLDVIRDISGLELKADTLTDAAKIPTLNEWMLFLLAGLLAIGAYAELKRRR